MTAPQRRRRAPRPGEPREVCPASSDRTVLQVVPRRRARCSLCGQLVGFWRGVQYVTVAIHYRPLLSSNSA